MQPVEDLERELARVTAERDALARHVERLIAPVVEAEVYAAQCALAPYDPRKSKMDTALEFAEVLIAARRRAGRRGRRPPAR